MEQFMHMISGHMYVVVIAVICLAMLAGSVIRAVTEIATTSSRERSRREIASAQAKTVSADQ